ncbi:MAG: molybdopterin-guanine dinucleotide biosynthesis protein B [Endozoicomonas sp.]
MSSTQSSPPVIGFAAYSGTGKTTLLEQLIPILVDRGLNIGLIKASHHDVDPDTPGKDSYRLRKAGSTQLVLSTPQRSICYTERKKDSEPRLAEQLRLLDLNQLDLVVVEGFRDEAFPKIELHRRSLERPLLHPNDSNIIAIAWDLSPGEKATSLPLLDINNPGQIATFILEYIND